LAGVKMSGFSVKSNFFCIFKTGDNINYNLEILSYLYQVYENSYFNNKKLLIKPIVIILGSICEAILYDFYMRIRLNTSEGVIGVSDVVATDIRSKKIDEFGKYIACAKKNDFFDLRDTKFYERLDELRIVRNRVHIQNSKHYKPIDESEVFNEESKKWAEICTEIVVKTMSKKYWRPEYVSGFVADLKFPWSEHLSIK
jgi:hypothetical protein